MSTTPNPQPSRRNDTDYSLSNSKKTFPQHAHNQGDPIQLSQESIGERVSGVATLKNNKPEAESLISLNRFSAALSESSSEIVKDIKGLYKKAISSTSGIAITTLLIAGFFLATYSQPVQVLGALAGAIVIRAGSFKLNSHMRAQQCIGQITFATHMALLGVWSAVLQSSVTAFRCGMQNMLPDESRRTRVATSVTGMSLGIGIFAAFFNTQPLIKLANIPMAVIAITSLSECLPKKHSWLSRICSLTSASLLIPFHTFISGSYMGVCINTLGTVNLLRSIYKHDIRSSANKTKT